MDWDCLLHYTNNNKEVAYTLLGIFSEEIKVQLVNTEKLFSEGDYNEIQNIVHRIKSNLKLFGFTDELDLSERLEQMIRQNSGNPDKLIMSWLECIRVVQTDVDSHLKKR